MTALGCIFHPIKRTTPDGNSPPPRNTPRATPARKHTYNPAPPRPPPRATARAYGAPVSPTV